MAIKLLQGDCLERMRDLPCNSVDSIVTDPPYGLGFMGKKWDVGVPAVDVFAECLRVLKPGGHLLAFGGSRTYHRLAVAVEDGGFEIRDQIMWVYGQGFPKSQNVRKAIDKAAGAEREVVGVSSVTGARKSSFAEERDDSASGFYGDAKVNHITAPATDAARQWDGWGTALKPAHEPIVVARKPLAKGSTVAANVLAHGTGALNIDGCRVAGKAPVTTQGQAVSAGTIYASDQRNMREFVPHDSGRWPANLITDGSDEVLALFPFTKNGGASTNPNGTSRNANVYSGGWGKTASTHHVKSGDAGSAARFFYQAKASRKDRGEGNKHPTVKPTDLMRYLCRLVTPPRGVVLDPFMGSGSTGKAAVLEGFDFIGIELDPEYFAIAEERIHGANS